MKGLVSGRVAALEQKQPLSDNHQIATLTRITQCAPKGTDN